MSTLIDGDFDSRDEEVAAVVDGKLQTIGLDSVFRRMDATDADTENINIPTKGDDFSIDVQRWGFEFPADDSETYPEDILAWRTNHLVSQVSNHIFDTINGANIKTVSDIDTAIEALGLGSSIDIVLTSGLMGTVGEIGLNEIKHGGVRLSVEPRAMQPQTALVVDRDRFGYRVDAQDLEVKSYAPVDELDDDDEESDYENIQVTLKRDYVVMDDDAARWVDLTG